MQDLEFQKEQILQRRNLEILKELIGKKITLQSNIYFDKMERKDYLVEDIKEVVVNTSEGLKSGVVLLNKFCPPQQQPFLEYPPILIKKEVVEGKKNKLTLSYPKDIDIMKDFRSLYKKTIPDLEIYILF